MSENLAANVEEVANAVEQTSRSVDIVAKNSLRITENAGEAASSAHEMDRSIRSVASMAKDANDITTRLSRETEEGGSVAQKSIEGAMRIRESMQKSAEVIKEVGK